jgi:hypothetical protein
MGKKRNKDKKRARAFSLVEKIEYIKENKKE